MDSNSIEVRIMQELKDLTTIEVDYASKPKTLPSIFKKNDVKTYRTFVSSLIIYDSPYQFLLAITKLLKPQHSNIAKEYFKDPSKYEYFVEWFIQSRCILESQLLTNYMTYGDSTMGKAFMKLLEKRFRNNFNDKTIEIQQLKESGNITQDTKIEFIVR